MSTSTQTITPLRQRMIDDMRIRNLADNTISPFDCLPQIEGSVATPALPAHF